MNSASDTRFVDAQYSGLKTNGLLLAVTMVMQSGKSWAEADLDKILINVNNIQKDSPSIQLLDSVKLSHALKFGDLNAGLSKKLTKKTDTTTGGTVRLVTYLDLGMISLGSEESVESVVQLVGAFDSVTYASIKVEGQWLYVAERPAVVYGYKSMQAVGGEQALRDVLGLYVMDAGDSSKVWTIRDEVNTRQINQQVAIDCSMALGRCEISEDIGQLFTDDYNIGRDLNITGNNGSNIFIHSRFYDSKRASGKTDEAVKDYDTVIEKIKQQRPEKFSGLAGEGRV
jgi:hypothetical protein